MFSIKRHIIYIAVVMISAVALVGILATTALDPITKKNGFNRTFSGKDLKRMNVIEKPSDVEDFAGSTNDYIYFKTKDPAKVYALNRNNGKSKYITYHIPDDKRITNGYTILVDSPFVTVAAGNVPGIFQATLNNNATTQLHRLPSLFTRSVMVNPTTYVCRMFEKLNQKFTKVNIDTDSIDKEVGITEETQDAGLSTDGELLYDNINNQLIYVHYYNNSLLFIDTNLNLIERSKTIDTIAHTELKMGKTSQRTISNLTPKRFVNWDCSLDQGNLHVNSRIIADNEEADNFSDSWAIDIYDVKSHEYISSYYIPSYNKEKPKFFKVLSNEIFVIYDAFIVTYSLL